VQFSGTPDVSNRVARWLILRPKNPNLAILWRPLEGKILVYFTAIWYNSWPFGVIYGHFV
jgi:hypothetical protein